MSVATLNAALAAGCARTHGEPVVLPTGTVHGVFDLPGQALELRPAGTRAHGALELRHQAAPVLHLCSADAAPLKEGDAVTVRGVAYLAVRLDADGAGMTRVELMRPGAEPALRPEWRQWR